MDDDTTKTNTDNPLHSAELTVDVAGAARPEQQGLPWATYPMIPGLTKSRCAECNAYLNPSGAGTVKLRLYNSRVQRYEQARFCAGCGERVALPWLDNYLKARAREAYRQKQKEVDTMSTPTPTGEDPERFVPSQVPIEACRSCKAPVRWLRHASTGKASPIDAMPSTKGNLEIDLEAGTYYVVPAFERGSRTLYLNHFATCPHAQDWARRAGHAAPAPAPASPPPKGGRHD